MSIPDRNLYRNSDTVLAFENFIRLYSRFSRGYNEALGYALSRGWVPEESAFDFQNPKLTTWETPWFTCPILAVSSWIDNSEGGYLMTVGCFSYSQRGFPPSTWWLNEVGIPIDTDSADSKTFTVSARIEGEVPNLYNPAHPAQKLVSQRGIIVIQLPPFYQYPQNPFSNNIRTLSFVSDPQKQDSVTIVTGYQEGNPARGSEQNGLSELHKLQLSFPNLLLNDVEKLMGFIKEGLLTPNAPLPHDKALSIIIERIRTLLRKK